MSLSLKHETMIEMRHEVCHFCDHQVHVGDKYCSRCHSRLPLWTRKVIDDHHGHGHGGHGHH